MILATGFVSVFAVGATKVLFPEMASLQKLQFSEGDQIFKERCARCHINDIERQGIVKPGPPLMDLASVAATRMPGVSNTEYVLESIMRPNAFRVPGVETQMPGSIGDDLSDNQLRALVGYLLQGDVSRADLAKLDPSQYRTQEKEVHTVDSKKAILGSQLFRGKGTCIKCHSGDVKIEVALGPGLFFGSLGKRDELHKSIVKPNAAVAPNYRVTKILMADGKAYSGLVRQQTEDVVQLDVVDTNNDVQTLNLAISDIEVSEDGTPMIEVSEKSIMPEGFEKLLSPEEIDSIVEYLYSVQ